MDLQKFERQLRLMMLLTQNTRYTVQDLAEQLEMTTRSIYRYLDAFKMAGFVVEKKGNCYRLDKSSPYFKNISELVHFTEEEALLLKPGGGESRRNQRYQAKSEEKTLSCLRLRYSFEDCGAERYRTKCA